MANVEEFSLRAARKLTEFEALVATSSNALDAIPGAVYLCDHNGFLVRYNSEAADLWGRSPEISDRSDRFCGSRRLFRLDGTLLPHDECPMADAITIGTAARNAEVVIERPDGSRFNALVNIRPLRDHDGRIQGAINCFQDITAHKQAEAEIRQKTTDLEDFFENSAVALHIVSCQGIILRANKAELALLGYKADEYIGRHIAEFHADAPAIGEILHRLTCGEKLDRFPARLRAKDGSIKHVLITSNSRMEDGAFVNTRCFTTDVTSLCEAEAARRESEERLAATYQAAPVGISETDADGRLLRVNDALCTLLDQTREELLGTTFFDYTYAADREEDIRLYALQVRGELDRYSIRKRARKANGDTLYLDVQSSSVRNPSGGFRHGVRVVQDVTRAKIMEDRIRASEGHLRDLLEALPAAVYTTDAEGKITFYNKAAIEMAGCTPAVGDKWCVTWRLYRTDGTPLPHDECPMAIAIKENRPVRGEEAIAERPDGSRVPFVPYPTPLHDAEGTLIGAINMLVDITERKQADNRQRTLIGELNHRVKNTLATVQSLAFQTARHAQDLPDFVRRFEARLLALARAHDLLTKRHWESAPLGALALDVLAPLMGGVGERMQIDGPHVSLNPRAALSITMALNELATNSVKHGALVSPEGSVALGWVVRHEPDRAILQVDWQEKGGAVVVPPARRGFGMRLIQRCVEGDLAGKVDLSFDPSGVACRMSFPLGSAGE
jgi:PAS domain S-box-containing protein